MLIYTLTAPSGAGKTTIVDRLQANGEFVRPITTTSRLARAGEIDGVHYHFVDAAKFASDIRRGEMFEHAMVYGNYYGITKASLDCAMVDGRPVLWIVDTQGMLSVKQQIPCVSIFVTPPSLSELERRLSLRGDTDVEDMRRRLVQAGAEMSNIGMFDHVVVNDDLEACCTAIRQIVLQHNEPVPAV